jgi:hypothetical protein
VTGLFERLEAKQRRRLVQPIQITNPGPDQQVWMGVTAALQVAQNKPDDERDDAAITNLQKQLDDAWERVRSHYVDVELQSMPRADWNAAMTEWQGEDGIDWAEALAPLVAACCVDPDAQDPERWRALLAQESWSEGDINSLRMAVLALNVDGLDARLPKD